MVAKGWAGKKEGVVDRGIQLNPVIPDPRVTEIRQ